MNRKWSIKWRCSTICSTSWLPPNLTHLPAVVTLSRWARANSCWSQNLSSAPRRPRWDSLERGPPSINRKKITEQCNKSTSPFQKGPSSTLQECSQCNLSSLKRAAAPARTSKARIHSEWSNNKWPTRQCTPNKAKEIHNIPSYNCWRTVNCTESKPTRANLNCRLRQRAVLSLAISTNCS